jgi:NDP-sugar pyrophosphorylase family protein
MITAAPQSPDVTRFPTPSREQGGVVAIVLAGGYAWRGTPFDALLPRPVLPVALKPLIAYPLEWLRTWGIDQVTICADSLVSVIQSQLQPYLDNLPSLEFRSDAQPRGAAGCARDAALCRLGETFVVVDGNTIPDVDLSRVLREHRQSKAAVTVVAQPAECWRDTDDAQLVPTGIYVFARRALERVPPLGYQDIKESLIPQLRRAGERVMMCEADGACPRVLDSQSYLAIDGWMVRRLALEDPRRAAFPNADGSPIVHPSAHVDPSALLVGPVLVDEGARVMADATIVGPVTIGRDSVVGARALVSRSIVWAGCTIGEGAMLDRSVLADDIVVPPAAQWIGVIEVNAAASAGSKPRARRVPRRATRPAVGDRALAFQ